MKRPDQDIIHRYLEGQCSPEEAELVLHWLSSTEGQTFYADYLDKRIEEQPTLSESLENLSLDDKQMLGGIYAKIAREEKSSHPTFRYWYAAAVVFLLLSTWMVVQLTSSGEQTFQTAYGEVKSIQLPDGSDVVLNANSKLWYAQDNPREIWFEGEAFFEVIHTEDDAPFSVRTADLVVNVLGTAFNVNTRRSKTDVVLSTGKVRLELQKEAQQPSLMMQPGDKVTYASTEKALEKKVVNPAAFTSWTSGTIMFDHTRLGEIFQLMEDNYGVEMVVADSSWLNKEFTGEVVQDLDVMVTLLEKTFDFTLTKQDNKIYLK
ncbi:FecR family protein [Catalinimonas niigatensis]|uniref:FecR family protein n=1 Tax=Catalinimonas niigatensis TaxID=1397264 RepID=UPI0026671E53|nr:FecR family protein [Catalinimonas niigatensis]WPP50422.1 FecR domain-containing protein [Catalinimonas niigatensis]